MDYTRQYDIVDPRRLASAHIDLVGAGGIGSPTGLMLTKMGCQDLRVFDDDRVEAVNLASQLYRLEDARHGAPKSVAAQQIWREFSGVEVDRVAGRAENHPLRGIVILGVDSMAARSAIWERRIRDCPQVEWLIDARMGAETGVIFTVRPFSSADQHFYQASLYADDEALALPCTGRAVLFNTFWIAALIGRLVKRIVMEQPIERRIDFDLDDLKLVIE
jgi:adenylyltransferase/sulfurtransferase